MRIRPVWGVMVALGWLIVAALACEGTVTSMTVNGTPAYICPSATPRPTDVMPFPNPPTYPYTMQANLDYYYVDPTRSLVQVQYLAQSVGMVTLSYQGVDSSGGFWSGSNGFVVVAYVPSGLPGVSGKYPIVIPASVVTTTITVNGAGSFTVPRLSQPLSSNPNMPPCCLAAPIFPTPQPTYTPYPTPTLFEMTAPTAFFLDDPVYNFVPPIQVRLRMLSPITEQNFPILPLLTAATWDMQVTNVGQTEFDFLGGLETYVNEVKLYDGTLKEGLWSPSHQAAAFLGIVEQAYDPMAIMPGQTVNVKVAAWIPATSHVTEVSFILDTPAAGDPGYATFVPGVGKIVTWVNQKNMICEGEIQYP